MIFGVIIANSVPNSSKTITLDKTKFDMFEAIQKETKSTITVRNDILCFSLGHARRYL